MSIQINEIKVADCAGVFIVRVQLVNFDGLSIEGVLTRTKDTFDSSVNIDTSRVTGSPENQKALGAFLAEASCQLTCIRNDWCGGRFVSHALAKAFPPDTSQFCAPVRRELSMLFEAELKVD